MVDCRDWRSREPGCDDEPDTLPAVVPAAIDGELLPKEDHLSKAKELHAKAGEIIAKLAREPGEEG